MPTGLENNDSELDMLILLNHDIDDSSSVPDDTRDLPDDLIDDQERGTSPIAINDSSDDSDDIPPVPTLASAKRKENPAPEDNKPHKKTKPKAAISAPAPTKTAATKPVTAKDKFSVAVMAEEETAQQLLKLKWSKQTGRKDVELERLKLQASAKADKARAKLELARLKLTQEHKYRMAQIGASQPQAGPSSRAASAFASSGLHGFSFYDDMDLPVLHTPSSDSGSTAQGMDSYDFSSMSSGFA
ncbi:hypothetical protein C8R44DRAFT_888002 [Mycena epipterygia]|nr:hypothetical protein C8R44DRAFT_888002 [Mycena epipterygia]